MSHAKTIANKVLAVLTKQVIDKGYVVPVMLSKIEKDTARLDDTGQDDKVLFEAELNVVMTRHDVSLFPMEVGGNPEDLLDFIWIADNGDIGFSPEEGMRISYLENNYIVCAVSPTYMGGILIIKECRARKIR